MKNEPNLNDLSHWPTGERIARLEQKAADADKALDLARESVSINSVIAVITILISIVALVIVFIKK